MAIFYDDKFYKSVPGYPNSPVMLKVKKFAAELENNDKVITKLSHGFYCRKVRSVDNRYKFRVTNGDRIIFCYQNNHQDICLLKYCSHDKQILAAKNIKDIHISKRSYKEDEFDRQIDEEVLNEIKNKILSEDITGAYNTSKDVSNKTRLSKNLRKTIIIKEFQDKYKSIMNADKESGLLIDTHGKSDLFEGGITYAMNRVFSEYHVILAPYFKIIIPGTVIMMPFFSENANKETNIKKYIDILVKDLYKKIGMTPQKTGTSSRPLLLQGFFYSSNHQEENMYIEVDPYEKTIKKISKNNISLSLNNTRRINSYLHTLSLVSPERISQKNFEYLFGE